ncbi:MAG: serine/threonine protein kinase [Actinobacteria bacterium]|nr:serine/threonine protein kinase [Actinomycetota bacterium]
MSRPLPGSLLLQPLHLGPTTHVWLARLDGVDEAVVIKRVADPDDRPARERLASEAERAAAVVHPDLLRPIAVLVDGPGPAVAYPYLSGGSLRTLLEHRGALVAGELVAILDPVARALTAWAATCDAHGDLKPENILLRDDGSPVVADAATPGHATPAYLDPAVAAGGRCSSRSDVFSLGVIAYEALTGRLPHRGPPAEVVALAAAGAHRDLASWPGVDLAMARVVESALAPEPARRPASPAAFVGALAAVVEPMTIVLPGPTPGAPRNVTRPGTETLEFGPRPPDATATDDPAPRWGWVLGASASAAAVLALAFLGPPEEPSGCTPPTVGPGTVAVDLDADGCDDLARWDGVVLAPADDLAASAGRLRLGGPGVQIRFGDWDGDGATTVAAYEPEVGLVRYLDDLADPTNERTEDAAPGGVAVVVEDGDGDRLEVRRR